MIHAFRGAAAVLTGASHGIGEAIALQLSAQGARLVLAARRADELDRVARACRAAGAADVLVVPTDVTDPAACAALIDRAVAAYERIDLLVNNAGLGMWSRVDEVRDLTIFERVLRVNYLGAVYCTHAALPYLKASRGRILCVSSLAGRTGVPLRSGYAASKHAMGGFFDSLRIELAGTGVTITMAHPGFVATGAQGRNLSATGQPLGVVPIRMQDAMTAEDCAARCVAAAAARKRELVMTARGKFGVWLKLLLPGLVDRVAAKAIAEGK